MKQQDQATPTVSDRSTEFVPVEGSAETSSAAGLLTAAYILMWLVVFAFVFVTSKRLKEMAARLATLEAALTKADETSRRP